jgi:hydroxyacylglutathione hydrolase
MGTDAMPSRAQVRIEAIPMRADNYGYALISDVTDVVIVDPTDGRATLEFLRSHQLRLREIWCTHHHADHVAGVPALLREHPGTPVVGSSYDLEHRRIEGQTVGLSGGQARPFGDYEMRAMSTPGHTLGAVTFVVGDNAFTGDTLFVGGCGRLFEGTAHTMHRSLDALRRLPPSTQLFCGHEYTVHNLEFARTIEPDNHAIDQALVSAIEARRAARPTVPGTLSCELLTNPFLRWDAESVRSWAERTAGARSDVDVFAAVRRAKDGCRART